jgi:hypothetical protein
MDASIYGRYRRAGGTEAFPSWESSEGLTSWGHAPAPARVAKRFIENVLGRDVSPRYARALNNATHWGFGLAAGAAYGLLLRRGKSRLWYGPPFGAAVWASGYVVLPQLGVYKQIWEYDAKTLRRDLSHHLVFGTATAAAFSILATDDQR